VKKICALALAGSFVLFATRSGATTITEDFSTDPVPRGWKMFGDTRLFQWDSTSQTLAVTWDSSQTNSYFYHPLGTILTTKLKASFAPALIGLGLTGGQQRAIDVAGGHGTLDPAFLGRLHLSPDQAHAVTRAFTSSFMDGFHVAMLTGGLVLVVAAIVANRFIPGRDTVHVRAPGDEQRVAVEV